MSVLNQIQGGRWDGGLRAIFSMKQGAVAPVVASEIIPALVLENDRPENFAVQQTRICTGFRIQGAVAAERQMVQLFNPVGSGVLAVCTSLGMVTGANITVDVSHTTVELATVSFGFLTDTRLFEFNSAQLRSTCNVNNESNAVPVTNTVFHEAIVLANTNFKFQLPPIILKPGTGIVLIPTAVNTHTQANFSWYERSLNPSEEAVRLP